MEKNIKECEICSKKFESEESLFQHKKAKHGEEKKTGKSLKKYFLIFGLIVAIAIIAASFYLRSNKPSAYDGFAECLGKKAVIYGNDFCQYTNKQLNMFGNSEKYLNYVKCIDNKELCESKNIKITPTWEIEGKNYEGVQSFEKLADLSGCEI